MSFHLNLREISEILKPSALFSKCQEHEGGSSGKESIHTPQKEYVKSLKLSRAYPSLSVRKGENEWNESVA